MAMQRQYVINERGKKTAVVLNMRTFDRMQKRLEDLEDALELKDAVKGEHDFRDLRDIRAEERSGRRSGSKK